MERAPSAEKVFFPLDEELELLPGNLAPRQQEHLVHLACFMPFDKAAEMVGVILSVQTNEETARQLTEQMGACMEAAPIAEVSIPVSQEAKEGQVPQRCVISSDGAMVSLIHKQWAEVRTLAIGEPQEKFNANGVREIHVGKLSYFSRLADASSFIDLAEAEIRRRKVREAKQVSAVMDGADWCQSLTDRHRPDAVRILDFPHAGEHITKLLETLENAGMRFPTKMLERCLHILKHRGPRPLLRMAGRLGNNLAQQKGGNTHLDYLRKREALMQYPQFRQDGWPIGSGMVESANKNVVEARLKGTGMHWERKNVNPMLTLRNAVCNDRWQEMWQKALNQQRKQQALERSVRHEQRSQAKRAGGHPTSAESHQSGPETELSPIPSSPLLATTLPPSPGPYVYRNEEPHRDVVVSAQGSSEMRSEVCLFCGTLLIQSGGRRTRRYCSNSCRVRACYQRRASVLPSALDDPTPHEGSASPQGSSETRSQVCLFCGTLLVQSGGRTKRYCSDRCRVRAYYQRQASASPSSLPRDDASHGVNVPPDRSSGARRDTCLFCGTCIEQSIGGRRTRRYCSDSCRVRAYYQRRGRGSPLSLPLDDALHGVNVSPKRLTETRQDTCLCCGIPLMQSRSRTKRYCSDRCRVRAYQKRQAKMS